MAVKFNTIFWKNINECPRDAKYRLFYSETSNEFRVYNWPVGCVIGHWKRNRNHTRDSGYAYDGHGDVSFHPTQFMNLPKKPHNAKA